MNLERDRVKRAVFMGLAHWGRRRCAAQVQCLKFLWGRLVGAVDGLGHPIDGLGELSNQGSGTCDTHHY